MSRLDISRSTIDRGLRELSEHGIVIRDGDKWRLTVVGRCVLEVRKTYQEQLTDLISASRILDSTSTGTPVNGDAIVGAEIFEASTSVPGSVTKHLLRYVEEATEVRAFAPKLLASDAREFYEASMSGSNAVLELIVPFEVFVKLREVHPDTFGNALQRKYVEIYCSSVACNFSLWILDDQIVGTVFYSDHGVSGVLINSTSTAIAWAKECYSSARSGAEPIFLRGSSLVQ